MPKEFQAGHLAGQGISQQPATVGASNANKPTSDEAAQRALDDGDREKIDDVLADLNVSTTESGRDQTAKSDTEGSNSSSKNLDEQKD
ncbi:hypothetical protein [Caballeronia temeraria]|uniref:hypothetical protein n=1 Tax=Caballeronia temeraria TaxID=1777137 RepID=UPI001FC9B728|nr:hypothetical protein [Caballeronia temeraria]